MPDVREYREIKREEWRETAENFSRKIKKVFIDNGFQFGRINSMRYGQHIERVPNEFKKE